MTRQQKRFARLRKLDLCINGPDPDTAPTRRRNKIDPVTGEEFLHGKPVRGGKCQQCLDVHKRSDTNKKRYKRAYNPKPRSEPRPIVCVCERWGPEDRGCGVRPCLGMTLAEVVGEDLAA